MCGNLLVVVVREGLGRAARAYPYNDVRLEFGNTPVCSIPMQSCQHRCFLLMMPTNATLKAGSEFSASCPVLLLIQGRKGHRFQKRVG